MTSLEAALVEINATLNRLHVPFALVGGLATQSLVRFQLDGERVGTEERVFMGRRIRDVAQTPDGALLVIVDAKSGDLLRLTATPRPRPQP